MYVPRFLTIRQTARTGIISEHRLRQMVKEKNVPGIYSGSRFLVNLDQFIEQLNVLSKTAGQGTAVPEGAQEEHETRNHDGTAPSPAPVEGIRRADS